MKQMILRGPCKRERLTVREVVTYIFKMYNFYKRILIPIFVCAILQRFSNGVEFQPQYNLNSSDGILNGINSNKSDAFKLSGISKCLTLLQQGGGKIVMSKKKDLNLILGLTGSGKSTFTAWIAGDDSKLIAQRVGAGTFIIEDEDSKIGSTTFVSKTTWPEIQIDVNDQSVFYDLPGFDETRGSANDISQAYFIKKIADHAEKVKIILIVSHYSVVKSESRKDFASMLEHITKLIPNIGKFKDSIALIATKVDKKTEEIDEVEVMVPDETMIDEIGSFVVDAKKFYLNSSRIDVKANENKIKLLDALLTKVQNKYSRIGIFRRPFKKGRLSKDKRLVKGKKHIQFIIKDTLKYAPKNDEDFSYSISAASKNDVGKLVEEINKNIWTNANEMVNEVKENIIRS